MNMWRNRSRVSRFKSAYSTLQTSDFRLTGEEFCNELLRPRDRRQLALPSHDRFDHLESRVRLAGGEAGIGAPEPGRAGSAERTDGTQVGRPAVDDVVGASRAGNRGDLRVDRHRL